MLKWLASGLFAIWCAAQSPVAAVPPAHQPAFQLDVPNPTADKPQSKLWFARNSWWAWLLCQSGSIIWQRTPNGWQRKKPSTKRSVTYQAAPMCYPPETPSAPYLLKASDSR